MKQKLLNFVMAAKNGFLYVAMWKLLAVLCGASLGVLALAYLISGLSSFPVVILLLLVVSILVLDTRVRIRTQEATNQQVQDQFKDIKKHMDKTHTQVVAMAKTIDKDIPEQLKERNEYIAKTTLEQNRNLYVQIESLLNLQQQISIRKPLPSMSRWAATSELALLIVDTIKKEPPKTVVDLGSGVSSLVAGYTIEQLGEGRVISVDHEEEFYEKTRQTIQGHELEDVIDLRHAPLRQQKAGEDNYEWYDMEKLQDVDNIDLLIVDGPPGKTQKHARYPAVPLLYDKLSKGATIILDDYSRQEEKEITKMWLEKYPQLSFREMRSEKGMAILKKYS